MTTISVPVTAKKLKGLFKKARHRDLILQSSDGHRFLLAPVEEWEAFEVGEDFTQNKKLMKFLMERRTNGKRIPLEEIEAELGLRQKG